MSGMISNRISVLICRVRYYRVKNYYILHNIIRWRSGGGLPSKLLIQMIQAVKTRDSFEGNGFFRLKQREVLELSCSIAPRRMDQVLRNGEIKPYVFFFFWKCRSLYHDSVRQSFYNYFLDFTNWIWNPQSAKCLVGFKSVTWSRVVWNRPFK